jgi:hypothetical protein
MLISSLDFGSRRAGRDSERLLACTNNTNNTALYTRMADDFGKVIK